MANMEIIGGDDLELQLSRLAQPEMSKRIVRAGANPVADEIRKRLINLPEDKFRKLGKNEVFVGVPKQQKQDLLDSLGVAPADIDREGNANTKIGFQGYGSYPTKKYPKGVPNPLLARAVESGSSVRKKTPFVRPAVNSSKDKAIEAMQDEYNKIISQSQ